MMYSLKSVSMDMQDNGEMKIVIFVYVQMTKTRQSFGHCSSPCREHLGATIDM